MTETPAIEFAPLSQPSDGAAVAFAGPGPQLPRLARELDEATEGLIARAARIAQFQGRKKTHIDILAPQGVNLDWIVVMGLGEVADYAEADWLHLGGAIRARLAAARARVATILLEIPGDGGAVGALQAANVALGLMLRGYEFKKYKQVKKAAGDEEEDEAEAGRLKKVCILCPDPDGARAAFEHLKAVGEGVFLARDLINEPANMLGPVEFAERLQALGRHGVEVEVLDEAGLAAHGLRALLAVGQGSARPSLLAVMRWRGEASGKGKAPARGAAKAPAAKAGDAGPLVFVGKGVCFDSGGVSIKPAPGMEEMKADMGGAACVAGLMLALAKRKAPVDVVGVVGLVENMPGGKAQRPGDIVISMSGKSVEVLNTDAEGRLVLADAMWYAQETFKPRFLITLATLTGAIVVALGKEYAGLFSNDDQLAGQLARAGEETEEKVWRLPMGPKYDKMIDSKIADMKNVGDRAAGSITAAQFLQRFVQDKTPWAHVDLAGVAMGSPATEISQGWTSGFGVRLLDRLVSGHYEA